MMRVKELLNQLDVRPSKNFGQNFLHDLGVIEQIIRFGQPMIDEMIVEIGPGLGALTAQFSTFPNVAVIELEQRFCAYLSKRYANIKIINSDIRFFDLSALGSNLTIFGNLPYSLSTEILFYLLANRNYIKRAILMLQKEFVERMAADHGSRTYGTLSIGVQLWADVRAGPVIAGSAFHPPTEVASRLVELTIRKTPRFEIGDEKKFQQLVQAAFRQRRKKIGNSIKATGLFESTKLMQAFSAAGLDPNLRAEQFSIEDFSKLAKEL